LIELPRHSIIPKSIVVTCVAFPFEKPLLSDSWIASAMKLDNFRLQLGNPSCRGPIRNLLIPWSPK
ncbi:MAG: hypothetical protein AAGK02_13305, partial [Pseudomonadota bacterium]